MLANFLQWKILNDEYQEEVEKMPEVGVENFFTLLYSEKAIAANAISDCDIYNFEFVDLTRESEAQV